MTDLAPIPHSVDNYPTIEQLQVGIQDMQQIARNHQRNCVCPYCMSIQSFSFMLRGPHPVIHRSNCPQDCYHRRAGEPLPKVTGGFHLE